MIEACRQGLLRAHETTRRLGREYFEKMFPLLEAYKQHHGNCLVPQRQGPLGTWVNNLRTRYKKNSTLDQALVRRLEAIGFVWVVSDDYTEEIF